jgi:hypothetical protein
MISSSDKLVRDYFGNHPGEVEPLLSMAFPSADGPMLEEYGSFRGSFARRMLPNVHGGYGQQINQPGFAARALLLSWAVRFSPAELSLQFLRRINPDWRVM